MMQKMWSTWRANYIDSFKSEKDDDSCVFCRSAAENISDVDSLVVRKGKLCYVTLNLYPYNAGHLMIIPNRHLSDFSELTGEELSEIMSFVQLSIKALKKIISPHGFNLGSNMGRTAGAGIDKHIHFHIVPRWDGDTNFMPVLGNVKVISHDLLRIKKNLIEAYDEILTENK